MSTDWWTDQRQNRRIKELQGEVEAAYGYAAQRSRALQSRLSEVQGTIERRLDRMATSFDAFVELSDLRLELAVFDREAAVRHRTRRLLMGLAGGAADPPPLGLDDCPGYWLKPAAECLSALVRGDTSAADAFAAEAVRRDEDRTTLFLTLGLATAGRHTEGVPWLARSLPALGTTVTAVQRQLWIACADGAFGEPGRVHVERRLTELIDEMPASADEQQRAQWLAACGGTWAGSARSLPRELQNDRTLTEPPVTAARLTALRTRVEAAVRPFDTAPAADFAALLGTLVDEGAPEERPIVARARELRQIIETGGADQPVAWDAPAGETLGLLRGDLFQRTAPGPRALAVRVGGRWIRSIAESLAEQASTRPPEEVDLRLYGHSLRIRPDGATALRKAEAEIDRAAESGPVGERLGMAVTAAGVVVLVLTIVAGLTALAVVAGLMAVVGAGIWLKMRIDRTNAQNGAKQDKDRLDRKVKSIADTLKDCHNSHKKRAETAAADREAILTVLA